MRRILTFLMIAIAALFATSAQADEAYVKMSGDWYNHGTAVKLPVYPPVQCTNFLATPAEAGAAECPKIVTPAVGTTHNKSTRGFRADGATVRVQVPPAGDGLTPGAPFTIPGPATLGGDAAAVPGDNGAAFVDVAPTAGQPARTVAVPLNIKVQQLNTRLSWRGPVRQRSEFINGGLFQGQNTINGANDRLPFNPGTRMFAAGAWKSTAQGGVGGQTGRLATTTTPVKVGDTSPADSNLNIPLSFKYSKRAGGQAFGGTMSVLISGNGRLLYPGPIFGSGFFLTSMEQPGVVTQPLNANVGNNAEPAGGGWWVTNLGGQPKAFLYKNAVVRGVNTGTPTTQGGAGPTLKCNPGLPIAPAGCDLIEDVGSIKSLPTAQGGLAPKTYAGASSVRNGFAFTTGRLTIIRTGTDGGAPQSTTFVAEGEDNTSVTAQGAVVRNIGLVAGRYAKRISASGTRYTHNLHGVQVRFTVPEPGTTLALVAGVGALGLLVRRRMR